MDDLDDLDGWMIWMDDFAEHIMKFTEKFNNDDLVKSLKNKYLKVLSHCN